MYSFKSVANGFNYVFEKKLAAGETAIVKMPPISPNKRGFNDIGWQTDGNITLYGTLSSQPEKTELWQEIKPFDEVNKTVSALKVTNLGEECTVIIRALMT